MKAPIIIMILCVFGMCFFMYKKMSDKKKIVTYTEEEQKEIEVKEFFDMIAPATIKFYNDYYVVGDTFRCVWAIKEYPPHTEEHALLSALGEKNNVTLRIYNRLVTGAEQNRIIQNAARRNVMQANENNVTTAIEGKENLSDVMDLMTELRKNREPLLHTAVFVELKAKTLDELRNLQQDIELEFVRSKITCDKLTLRQKEGFLSVIPTGTNMFADLYERVLPASSVANLYPFNFSGKTDTNGFYIGKEKYGTNVILDLNKKSSDITNSNVLVLGNSGQGKSFLMKLLICNILESGKSVIILDPEAEYGPLCKNLGGTYIDFLSGEYKINPLEPRAWGNDSDDYDPEAPSAFKASTTLTQHIAYLKDFFRAYKDFSDQEIDTIEKLLVKTYKKFNIDNHTDLTKLSSSDYPIMEDFYNIATSELNAYNEHTKALYTYDTLQAVCLGIDSMCVGTEARYFNGHTNIIDDNFVVFGVKGLLDTNKRLKDTMLFSILSYMNGQLLSKGNTVASIDELYLFLTNMTAIEYIRNAMKRVRKFGSGIMIASQNIEDFLLPEIKEFTKPLFSIPSFQFLFNPGSINAKDFMDTLSLEENEYDLIKFPEQGTCLFKCGNERHYLCVKAPDYKTKLFFKNDA